MAWNSCQFFFFFFFLCVTGEWQCESCSGLASPGYNGMSPAMRHATAAWPGTWDPLVKQLTPMLASWYWELVSLQIVCAWGFLSVLPVRQPASITAGNLSRQGGNCSASKTQHCKSHAVTPSIFCRNMEIQLQRDYGGPEMHKCGLGVVILEASYQVFQMKQQYFLLIQNRRQWILCERAQVWSRKTLLQNCDGPSLPLEQNVNLYLCMKQSPKFCP